ncbi:MAG: transglutaminase family protein [Acidobacteriota bacterium]
MSSIAKTQPSAFELALEQSPPSEKPPVQEQHLAPEDCLAPGRFVDSETPEVVDFARRSAGDTSDAIEKARRLYLAVRDGLRYNPFIVTSDPATFTASHALQCGFGFCVTKAALLAAVARAEGIPARLGFADVRNHLTTPKLRRMMGTDVFAYHGYTELWLDSRWVKATPAFNASLCARARIRPLEFDGRNDSIYHPFDLDGRRHMEYLRYRGIYVDIPFEAMMRCFAELYGPIIDEHGSTHPEEDASDFFAATR